MYLPIIWMAVLTFFLSQWLPWWILSPICFLVSLVYHLKPKRAFLAGFLAIALCWGGFALFIDLANGHILSQKVAALFKLPSGYLLVLVTAILGGLVGGLSSLTASFIKR